MTEQQNLRIVVEAFFGRPNTTHWEMNEALMTVVSKMLLSNELCSEAMDYVPRPGAYLNLKAVAKELARIATRISHGDKSYEICKSAVARNWRTEAEIAASGL